MSDVKIDPRKLRTLGKAAGLNVRLMFKMSPEDILKALKEINPELFSDVESWDTAKATTVAAELEEAKQAKKEKPETATAEEPPVQEKTEAKTTARKNTATKKKTEPAKKSGSGAKSTQSSKQSGSKQKEAAKKQESAATAERKQPNRKRPKKNRSGDTNVRNSQADILEMKERLVFLEDQLVGARTMISEMQAMQTEMMLFFTWWHNEYLNEDAEPEIIGIDWQACIDAQLKQ